MFYCLLIDINVFCVYKFNNYNNVFVYYMYNYMFLYIFSYDILFFINKYLFLT